MYILKCLYFVLSVLPGLARCQGQPFPVTGLITGIDNETGERPMRWNINDLHAANGPQWDLFILGLSQFQNDSEQDWLSYFGIAGIHGRPFIPWNGVGPVKGGEGRTMCTHGQILGGYIQKAAEEYYGDDSHRYVPAAQTWRFPYWDWASNNTLPSAVKTKEMTIKGPNGPLTVPNPLYSYRWQQFPLDHNPQYFPTTTPAEIWNSTETKRDSDADVNGSLNHSGSPLRDQVVSLQYRVFTSAKDFITMASTWSSGPSFENPHNIVHNDIGPVMADLEYSAFDPIFWLHHCNLDRLIALWQAINFNDTYLEGSYVTKNGGQYSVANGTTITAQSPLKPFYQDAQNFHTGITAATTKNFGYTYEGINDWNLTPEENSEAATLLVNQLYSNNPTQSKRRSHGRSWSQQRWIEYYIQIQVDRSELPRPSTVNIWLAEQRAGQMAILNMPERGLTHSEIPLDRALNVLGIDLDPDTVDNFLEKNLHVEIRRSDGTLYPVELVPSLSIEVQSEDVVPPDSDRKFPTYSPPTTLSKVGVAMKHRGKK
ncbi:uncharacterized protein BCR38DRAFT_346826 [Pseudomassariella vexata]|uniref:Tyrosinase copper-binding domain-containing protein n=1 Tax=Pseudomassariella vexata TaxID=1141098 RepID=A0A1Y2DTS3_9PEZI|nr:uncharacterized protein BCR38DRAFT_346826 [Pseudomassariella vexata]ORY62692.1 hypothetical protein BCR38DRAFT_346826 [Pseudomassariella vexata]